jgi:hypothetical protein
MMRMMRMRMRGSRMRMRTLLSLSEKVWKAILPPIAVAVQHTVARNALPPAERQARLEASPKMFPANATLSIVSGQHFVNGIPVSAKKTKQHP